MLVRTLLAPGLFLSVEDMQTRVLAFLDYDDRIMTKPFTWM
jgi:hypothetical protein